MDANPVSLLATTDTTDTTTTGPIASGTISMQSAPPQAIDPSIAATSVSSMNNVENLNSVPSAQAQFSHLYVDMADYERMEKLDSGLFGQMYIAKHKV
jgi:hypothetical protein